MIMIYYNTCVHILGTMIQPIMVIIVSYLSVTKILMYFISLPLIITDSVSFPDLLMSEYAA